jgi:hypothetical protein
MGDYCCYPHHDRRPPECTAGWVHTINLVVKSISAHRQPPAVRRCRVRNQLRVGPVPPAPATPLLRRSASVSWQNSSTYAAPAPSSFPNVSAVSLSTALRGRCTTLAAYTSSRSTVFLNVRSLCAIEGQPVVYACRKRLCLWEECAAHADAYSPAGATERAGV